MARRGFSLAEMMVAIGVLGIGLTMVACFFPVAMYQHADTMSQHRAMKIAREAKSLILQMGAEPNDPHGAYLGTEGDWLTAFLPRSDPAWSNVIDPPAPPVDHAQGTPPYYIDAPWNPEFDEKVRYIWYPFARRDGGTTAGTVMYLVVVTRRLPGQLFPTSLTAGGHMNYPAFDLLLLEVLDGRTVRFNGDLRNGWQLSEVAPPGSRIIGTGTWSVYTVLSAGADGPNDIVLRELIDPGDYDIEFLLFPPALDSGRPSSESPIVMTLFF